MEATKMISSLSLGMSVLPGPGVAGGRQFPPGKIVPEPGVAGGGLLQKYHLFGLKPAEKQHTVGVRA
jgi:hypothetical protein